MKATSCNKFLIFFGIIIMVMLFSLMNRCTQKFTLEKISDSLQNDRNQYIDRINQMIKGKEQVLVDSVFTNLKVLGGFPAENLVFAMERISLL